MRIIITIYPNSGQLNVDTGEIETQKSSLNLAIHCEKLLYRHSMYNIYIETVVCGDVNQDQDLLFTCLIAGRGLVAVRELRGLTYSSVRVGLLLALLVVLILPNQPAQSSQANEFRRSNESTDSPSLYLPLMLKDPMDLVVDTQSRQESKAFFADYYLASQGAAMDWNGDHATCNPGKTAYAFRHAIRMRINYLRAMAGVPGTIFLSPEYNRKAQQATLMMSVNNILTHDPDPKIIVCYTEEGDEAAGKSNLALGANGVNALELYMEDSGIDSVGHRRWILYPNTRLMGTGDVLSIDENPAANDLWVMDASRLTTRPATRDDFVAWPPPGYVPYQIVYQRWSFSYPSADFSSTSITMSSNDSPINLTILPLANGYGENTIVWDPDATFGSVPLADITYTVQLSNVLIKGVYHDFSYEVIVFNPFE
ncbi:MAG: CAP domain-containing protein [Chloroflexota bacterium]|nr:CAP domain-containing protein [Chloroflexota bacterium]